MNLNNWLNKPQRTLGSGTYDLVVPLDYATLLGDKTLPKAAVAGIERALELVKAGKARAIAWGNTPGFPKSALSNDAKYQLVDESAVRSSVVEAVVECTNSITEAERILETVPFGARIIVICDWRHARRTQKIWRHFFKGELVILTTNESWNEDHPSFWCRSNVRWHFANTIHYLLLIARGVESLRNVVHSVSKTT
jgi:hypothetical protein